MRNWISGALFSAALLVAVAPARAQWQYSQDEDKMTSKMTYFANVESVNSLDLDFPYRGRNHGRLWVRQSARQGTDAAIQIEKGQIICGFGEGDCMSTVRFDDGQPQRFSMARPTDGKSTLVFFENAGRFIAGAKKAKRIRVMLTVYQAGQPVLEFNTPTPLEWPPGAKKQAEKPAAPKK